MEQFFACNGRKDDTITSPKSRKSVFKNENTSETANLTGLPKKGTTYYLLKLLKNTFTHKAFRMAEFLKTD